MPDHDGEFTRGRDCRHMLATPWPDPEKESSQGAWRARRGPDRLYEHAASMTAALLGNPAVISRPWSRLPDTWIEAKVADKLLRFVETGHIANCSHDRERHYHVDARDRHQALDTVVRKSRAGQIALDHFQVLAQPVELAQMPFDREALVLRHDLRDEPGPALRSAEICMRARRDEIGMQNRMYDILETGSLSDNLIATRHLTAQCLGRFVVDPNFGQEAAGIELSQYARVDRIGFDLRVSDHAHLLRVRDHDLLDMRSDDRREAAALPVASITTVSSFESFLAKAVSSVRRMSTRPSRFSFPSSQATASAKARGMSSPMTRMPADLLSVSLEIGADGQHDIY